MLKLRDEHRVNYAIMCFLTFLVCLCQLVVFCAFYSLSCGLLLIRKLGILAASVTEFGGTIV